MRSECLNEQDMRALWEGTMTEDGMRECIDHFHSCVECDREYEVFVYFAEEQEEIQRERELTRA